MKVSFADAAIRELEDIGDYIARDNPRRAKTFVEEMREKCLGIGEFPQAYPLVERHTRSKIRKRSYRSYLIFYRVIASRVEIIHVLHGARDYLALLDG